MALGKSVVASNIKGYAGLVSDGVEGLLVPPKDDKRLAQALILLLKNKALREQMGAKGKQKVKDYHWEHLTQRILDYYLEVLNKSSKIRDRLTVLSR
jgi:phosphatidylinositol alpha-mannosyltransferase